MFARTPKGSTWIKSTVSTDTILLVVPLLGLGGVLVYRGRFQGAAAPENCAEETTLSELEYVVRRVPASQITHTVRLRYRYVRRLYINI